MDVVRTSASPENQFYSLPHSISIENTTIKLHTQSKKYALLRGATLKINLEISTPTISTLCIDQKPNREQPHPCLVLQGLVLPCPHGGTFHPGQTGSWKQWHPPNSCDSRSQCIPSHGACWGCCPEPTRFFWSCQMLQTHYRGKETTPTAKGSTIGSWNLFMD